MVCEFFVAVFVFIFADVLLFREVVFLRMWWVLDVFHLGNVFDMTFALVGSADLP